MPGPRHTSERFDVEMHQIAGVGHSYRVTGGVGVRRASRFRPARTRIAATVDRGTWSWTAIAQAVRRSYRAAMIRAVTAPCLC
jgi:hypothetical protein